MAWSKDKQGWFLSFWYKLPEVQESSLPIILAWRQLNPNIFDLDKPKSPLVSLSRKKDFITFIALLV
jgi:hypothetical protein